jgi:hypothetical protein
MDFTGIVFTVILVFFGLLLLCLIADSLMRAAQFAPLFLALFILDIFYIIHVVNKSIAIGSQ